MPHVSTEQLPLLAGIGLAAAVLLVISLPLLRDPASIAALEQAASTPGVANPQAGGSAEPSSSPKRDAPDEKERAPAITKDRDIDESVLVRDRLSAEDLAAATTVEQLKKLAREHPSDERVFGKLARTQAALPDGGLAALATLKTLFAGSSKSLEDKELQAMVTRAANGPPAVQAEALALMSSGMGSVGLDLLYELTIAPSVAKPVKQKALDLTKREDVRKLASPALLVALELRDHPACARGAAIEQAEKSGDKRSLAYLSPLLSTKGCGLFGMADCYACVDRAVVNRAIQAINGRSTK